MPEESQISNQEPCGEDNGPCEDVDNDTVCDDVDNCPGTPNQDQADSDGDGIGDACDDCIDVDNDTVCDDVDNCPGAPNQDQADSDGDGIGDACDDCIDVDNDTVCDDVDNCPGTPNQDQADSDGDGIGDACDDCIDVDNDTVCDDVDNCPGAPNQDQADSDGDGIGDACDDCIDVDNDTVCDDVDNCPGTPNQDQADSDGDGIGDACDDCIDVDNDTVCDDVDNCPGTPNQDQADSDGDGIGDACDEEDFTISGLVMGNGLPMAGATVKIGTNTVQTTTDDSGNFSAQVSSEDLLERADGKVFPIEVTAEGFATGYFNVPFETGKMDYPNVDIKLMAVSDQITPGEDVTQGVDINKDGENVGELMIPADSFPTGVTQITGSVTYIDPTTPDINSFPGSDFLAAPEDGGEPVLLESFGVMEFDLKDQDGNPKFLN